MDVTSGTRLGPYLIASRIGAGGMGEVWKAHDTRLDRSVAIKVLPAALADDPQLRLRFEREAKSISQLNHPHICTLHDVGRESGHDFLVMELLEGENLAERLGRGALPLTEAIRLGGQIAEALAKAHRQSIIHRDLKPSNIMLTKNGAKLLDFGLAKIAAPAVVSLDDATLQKPLTSEGSIVGTFQYMAPEQLEGLEADARTDIFALGCVLYEMITGRRAFEGATRTSLIAAIVSGSPQPISQLQPLAAPALEHVIRKCLEKDPDDRWQSAHDVAEELKWIGESGSHASASIPTAGGPKPLERFLWIGALLGVMAISAATATYLRKDARGGRSYRFLLPQHDAGYTRGTWPLISPDGSKVVFFATDSTGKRRLFLRNLDDFALRSWAHPANLSGELFWSPDSRMLAAISFGKLQTFDFTSGSFQTIAQVPPEAETGAWGPDGTFLLGGKDGPIYQVSPDRHRVEAITTPDRAKFELGHHAPVFLPDGRRFLFISYTRNPGKSDLPHSLYTGEIGKPEIRKIGEVTSKVRYARGHLFYVRAGALVAVPFDVNRVEILGEPALVAEDVGFFQTTGTANYSIADDGTVAWLPRSPAHRLVVVDREGRVVRPPGAYLDLRPGSIDLASDGKHAAVAARDASTGTFDLWMYGIDRPTATQKSAALRGGGTRHQSAEGGLPPMKTSFITA